VCVHVCVACMCVLCMCAHVYMRIDARVCARVCVCVCVCGECLCMALEEILMWMHGLKVT